MSQFVRITADPLIDDEFSAGYTGSLNTYIGSIGFAGSQGAYILQLNIDPTGFGGSIGYLGSNLSDVGILAGFVDENGFIGSVGWVSPGFLGSGGGGGGSGNGFTGSSGFAGSIGYTGSQGATGIGFTGSASTAAGFTGSIGFTGSQGAGFTGSAGSVGFVGSIGFTGSTGFTGSVGVGTTGFTGSIGFTGSSGFAGSQGTTGFVGSVGFVGSAGIGFVGSQGGQGISGTDGADGDQGDPGATGYVGSFGFTGSIGFTGSAGPSSLSASQTAIAIGNIYIGGLAQITGAGAGFDIYTPDSNTIEKVIVFGKGNSDGSTPTVAFVDEFYVLNGPPVSFTTPVATTVIGSPGARTYSNNAGHLHIAIASGSASWWIDVVIIRNHG